MYSGSTVRSCLRSSLRSARSGLPTRKAARNESLPSRRRATTAASAMPGCRAAKRVMASSTSAGSTRKPRTLTCASALPRHTMVPSGSAYPRSPVRYRRPAAGPAGWARKRSPVSSGCPMYPSARHSPARYSSPFTPAGTGRSRSSRTWTAEPSTGRPIGGSAGKRAGSPCIVNEVTTCDSVGPYWFSSSTPGSAAHSLRISSVTRSCSPEDSSARRARGARPRATAVSASCWSAT